MRLDTGVSSLSTFAGVWGKDSAIPVLSWQADARHNNK
jgi:hypothetical protein